MLWAPVSSEAAPASPSDPDQHTDQLRGPRRFVFVDFVSIRSFGRLCGLGGRRIARVLLRPEDASARRAWLTAAEVGKAADTSGSSRTMLEPRWKRS